MSKCKMEAAQAMAESLTFYIESMRRLRVFRDRRPPRSAAAAPALRGGVYSTQPPAQRVRAARSEVQRSKPAMAVAVLISLYSTAVPPAGGTANQAQNGDSAHTGMSKEEQAEECQI